MQVCGFLGGPRFDEVKDGVFQKSSRINSTWGGNLVDMVRAQKYLEIIEDEKLVDNAAKQGETLVKGLVTIQDKYASITNARGRGLFAAVDFASGEARDKAWMAGVEAGMMSLKCGPRSIRFRPALNVSAADITRGLEILDSVVKKVV